MKKILLFAIKIIPLITIYKGVTSGGNKLKPLLNLGKIIVTQYELKNITKIISNSYRENKGVLMNEREFPKFLNENHANEYSVIARKFISESDPDLSKDVWMMPFKLKKYIETNTAVISSNGQDKKYGTKDDIKMTLNVNLSREVKKKKKRDATKSMINSRDEINDRIERDQRDFDREGFDRDGLDEEGFDRDGFNTEGFDREGFDYNGIDSNGNERPIEESEEIEEEESEEYTEEYEEDDE
jgi:hypothetical protein